MNRTAEIRHKEGTQVSCPSACAAKIRDCGSLNADSSVEWKGMEKIAQRAMLCAKGPGALWFPPVTNATHLKSEPEPLEGGVH